ncbi:hypothetical protein RNO86_22615, partial [Escherichia coli]|nr:hypothetical protein [Escherichia coli]
EWVHVQLHQQKGMISLSPPTICNSALCGINIPRPIAGKGVRKFSLVAVMAFIEEIKAAGYPVALYHTHRSTL